MHTPLFTLFFRYYLILENSKKSLEKRRRLGNTKSNRPKVYMSSRSPEITFCFNSKIIPSCQTLDISEKTSQPS